MFYVVLPQFFMSFSSVFNHLRGPLQADLAYIIESHHSLLPQPGRFPLCRGTVRFPEVSYHVQFANSSMGEVMDFKLKNKTKQNKSQQQKYETKKPPAEST